MTAAASCDRNIPAAECLFQHVLPYLTDAKRAEPPPGAVDFFGGYDSMCPAHGDQHRSMRVSVGRIRLYLKCYAGCDELAIRDKLIRNGVPDRCLPVTKQRQASLVEQLLAVVTDPDLDHGHKLLLVTAFIRGRSDLPRGAELEELAASVGLSRSRAFDYRRLGYDPTSGSYGSDQKPVKPRRSTRETGSAGESDGRTKSDGRTGEREKSPMVGLNDKNRRPAA